MEVAFYLSPRYRLDDELPWLLGIDPSRHYWIAVNGDSNLTAALPGLIVSSLSELKLIMNKFRSLNPGEQMNLTRIATTCTIHCVSLDCYAVESSINEFPVWHIFDEETLDSLLMTAHPDWQCGSSGIDLGRKLLVRSLEQTTFT